MSFLDQVALDNGAIFSGEFSEPFSVSYREGSEIVTASSTCLFDETFEMLDPDTGVPMMSQYPRISVYLSAIEEATGAKLRAAISEYRHTARVSVRGKDYRIDTVQPDGLGCAVITLKKAPVAES